MMEILDTENLIKQRDPSGALEIAANEWMQLEMDLAVQNAPAGQQTFAHVVITGMGGSALSANLVRDWLDLEIPFEVCRDYKLPKFVGQDTLVIASSFSGNTEETLSALQDARDRGATVAITSCGGKLLELAKAEQIPHVVLPDEFHNHQRMGVIANLSAFVNLLVEYGLVGRAVVDELRDATDWLHTASDQWNASVPFEQNIAKQLAWKCAGKSPVIYAGPQFRGIAYKWKIGFNENAKNVAWCNEYPEFNHNEFLGWASHPVEKPYAVIDLRSSFDHPQISKRFEISDRLLSGQRPAAIPVELQGDNMIQQMLWGNVLGDFVSIYLAILNGVDPTNVDLIEKLKGELK